MDFFRAATPEEVQTIQDKADLTLTSVVWALPSKDIADVGVVRNCIELDPVFFAPTSGNSRKAMFFWGIANMLKATGAREIYFNIDADAPEEYKSVLTKLGAVSTTAKPQLRYKLVL